jgi:DNA-binding NtrC family response regulator
LLRILLVEDDPDVRSALAAALEGAGHLVSTAGDGALAVERLGVTAFDLVISDMRLPRLDGLAVFRRARETAPRTDVILMTSFANVPDAVDALKAGAHDYLVKPFDLDELVIRVRILSEKRALAWELEGARARLAAIDTGDAAIVGETPPMARLLDRLATVAASDAPVLVTGESGTGKELIARRLHARSGRPTGPFVAVNCAAFPETLLEAELFGYEKGAFTGAARRREGRFKAADGGTLFLDEIGEMPMSAQAKLLRVLQDRRIEPLGTNESVAVDVRIVSATNRDLKKSIAEGRFREDLYYRVNVIGLHIPPLRERPGDLRLLVAHFLKRFTPPGAEVPDISLRAWQALAAYPFPGNVRELSHAMNHAAILSRGATIELEHLPEDVAALASETSPEARAVTLLAVAMKQFERRQLLQALAVAEGKRSRAAELLGISRKNLWEKLRAHDISGSDFDDGA